MIKKRKILPVVVAMWAIPCVVLAGGDSDDSSQSLVDSSETAPLAESPVVEALSLGSGLAVESLSVGSTPTVENSSSSSSTTNETASTATATALTDGLNANDGFEAVEDEPILIDFSALLDPDRIGLTSLQWEVDKLDGQGWMSISGANSPVFIPRQDQVGHSLRALLSYTDGKGSVEHLVSPATSPVRNINDPPLGRLDLIGKPEENQVLRVDVTGVRDEDGAGITSFLWQGSLDGLSWSPLNSGDSTLVLSQSEVELYVRSVVSYVDKFGHPEAVISDTVGPVRNVNDNVVGTPTVSGPAIEGETLTLSMSDLTDPDGVYSDSIYWESSIDNTWHHIPGANSQYLELTRYLTGLNIRAVVSIVDRYGTVENTASAQVGPIEAVNVRPTGVLVFKKKTN